VRLRLIFFIFVVVVGTAAAAAALGERSPSPVGPVATRAKPEVLVAPLETTTTTAPLPTTTTTAIPLSRTVFIVGDSLTVDAMPFLPTTLAQVDWRASDIDAEHGRRTPEGLAVLAAHHDDLPPTVMVALGTNDLDATAEQIDDWVHQARVLVGNRRLVWVNLQLGDKPQFATYPAINQALASAGARYHVQIVDWASWSAAHGVQHLGDGIHYGLAGSALRAGFYAEMLRTGA